MRVKPIASLEPGKIYVLKARLRSEEEAHRLDQVLARQVPECRFLVLDSSMELVGSIPSLSWLRRCWMLLRGNKR
jgi:hypothetical protein